MVTAADLMHPDAGRDEGDWKAVYYSGTNEQMFQEETAVLEMTKSTKETASLKKKLK